MWRYRFGPGWHVSTYDEQPPKRHLPIGKRPIGAHLSERFPTHAAALAHALAETGLTKKGLNG